jgi:hypothetical protein
MRVAYFTVEEVGTLLGYRSWNAARGMFSDRGGPFTKTHPGRVRCPAHQVCRHLEITYNEAVEILDAARTEQGSAA